MIIDAHTRTWPGLDNLGIELSRPVRKLSGSLPLDASPAALERATEPLAGALIHGFRADRVGALIPNDAVADAVRQGNGRYVGIAGIDPTSGDAWDEFRRCTDLGLFGICVSPALQGFLPTDPAAMRLFERCAADGLPVFVSRPAPYTRNAAIANDRPTAWTDTMRQLPRLKVVFAGMGWPWIDECIAMMTAFENAWTDTSGIVSQPWALYNAMLGAVQHGVADRVRVGDAVPYRVSLAWQKQADILLLLLWDDPREQGVCPAKLFEYAGAGRPVLSLGFAGGVAADLIRARGLGRVGGDVPSIVAALRDWLAQKDAGGIAPPPPSARAGLSRQEQFSRLRDFLRAQGLER